MIEINLVPDVKQELIRAQRMRIQVISYSILAGIIAIAVVVALSIYVFGVQFGYGKWQDGQITSKYETLMQTKDLSKILTIQNQLAQIPGYHDSSPMTSRVFDMLSSINPATGDPNNITVSTLNIDTTLSTIDIQAQTSGYPALETFQKTLKAAKVRYTDSNGQQQEVAVASDINTSNVGYGRSDNGGLRLNFELEFTYAAALFDPTATSVTTAITGVGNATDSYLNLPKTLFEARGDSSGSSQ